MKKMKMIKKICQIIVGLLLGAGIARADLYTVSDILIAAELSSAKEARAAAIESGEMDAFWGLMEKMVASEDLEQVPVPEGSDITDWVQHVSLADEKTTPTKYMARLTVHFNEAKIKAFLTRNRIPFLTEELPSFVVIPIFRAGEQEWTLDEENPMYTHLRSLSQEGMIIPIGELEELVWLQAFRETGKGEILRKFANKYGVESVLIVRMNQGDDEIRVQTEYVPDQPALEMRLSVRMYGAEALEIMPNVWNRIVSEQKNLWRVLKTQDFKKNMTFWIQVPIRHLSDWSRLYQKLQKADFLENFVVRGFKPNEVWVTIQYNGTSDQLNRQLRPLGVQMTVGNIDGVWTLLPVTGG